MVRPEFTLRHWLPVLAVIGSIVSLTVGTSYGKYLFPHIGPEGTAVYRVAFAALILLVCWRPWKIPLAPGSLGPILCYGITLGLMNLVFYLAVDRLPMGIAIAIEFMGPLTIAIVSLRRLIDFVWIALAVIGLALLLPVTPGNADISPIGVAYALASAVLWALYIVFGKRLKDVYAGHSISLGMLIAALVLLPFGVARGGVQLLNPAFLVSGLVLAVMSSAVPYSLELYALRQLPKNTFSILLSLEPAVGALSGLFILHEHLRLTQWLAIASVMLASAGSTLSAAPEPTESVTVADLPADAL